ncbi:HAMP domain-containing histidine kinase [Paenibacillus thalictri]|uniref:histidine kinase n=2 Tax=Paenibacillus thalictri TaxID=2527873 RepID=A0A4Q9DUV3_9BACL|nr:HAMP domain-containing histidine kinase [Paenibacillus thalictri]
MKFRHSLLAKYLLIIVIAVMIWPIIMVSSLAVYSVPRMFTGIPTENNIYANSGTIQTMWHNEAEKLNGADAETIDKQLKSLKQRYPLASMFWVDGTGATKLMLPEQTALPRQWTAADSIQFMKASTDGDPFTVVAFIGEKPEQGFMTIQVARSLMKPVRFEQSDSRILIAIILSILAFFLFASWMFFYKIRKRLVHLQEAMTETDDTGIPEAVSVHKQDEIGQLERAFNHMIDELTSGRQREKEEEHLRKQLIANLSHDIRTPLTTIRGHAYSLHKEPLTDKGKASLELIDLKIDDLARLIENLMSYTLLSAGKYPLELKETDVIRLLRTSVASWYPVFEKEGIAADVSLPDHAVYWQVDPQWFSRILDNIFQNIVRHAKTGRYVGVRIEQAEEGSAVVIQDKGPGIESQSADKGAGIGLSIVSLMAREMNLNWEIVSTVHGTSMYISPKILNKI